MLATKDLVQVLRTLRKRPTQSVVIFSLIAIGVGASTAFYSVADALLLRPLPFDRAGRLMDLGQRLEPSGAPLMNSHQNLNDLRGQTRVLESVAVYTGAYGRITANGEPEYAQGMAVDRHFFSLLGVPPTLGRGFTAEEEQDSAPCTIILSHAFWQRHFADDPSVLGRNVLLDQKPCAVIGIMPQSFFFPFTELATTEEDFWLPLRDHSSGGDYDKYGIALLKAGVSLQQAEAEVKLIAKHISQEDGGHESHTFVLRPYREVIVADYLPMLVLSGGILICVLLVVCINVASLFLVESLRSRKEIEIRFALGGTRWQTMRVFLLRILTLTSAAAIAGMASGSALVSLVRKLLPAGLPTADQIVLNGRVLWFAAGVALATGALSGVWPVLVVTQKLHKLSLNGSGRDVAAAPTPRSRSYLVILQLAFSTTFLVITGLFGLSLYRLLDINPGMQLDHRLVLMLKPADSNLKTAESLDVFFSHIKERLLATPGVDAVAVSSDAPLGAHGTRDFHLKDFPPPRDSREWMAQANAVGPNYFQVLGIATRRGRSFTEADRTNGMPVAIVNELFANRFFGNKSPLGMQICVPSGNHCLWREIIGVVAAVRDGRIDGPPQASYFMPFSQAPMEFLGNAAFTMRTSIAPESVREFIRRHMPDLAPGAVSMASFTLEEMRSRQTIAPRARVWVVAALAIMALLLAAMGVYGVIAVTVEQRRKEIGIRVAMGASPQTIIALFIRNMSLLLVPGLLLGVTGAAMCVRYITSVLFETSPINPAPYVGAAMVVFAASTIATLFPVRRALQGNPAAVLRTE